MTIKYTPQFLGKLESFIADTDYILRYEKGNFQSGFCILNKSKVVVMNKFFDTESKINSLIEIIMTLDFDERMLSEVSRKLYNSLIIKRGSKH